MVRKICRGVWNRLHSYSNVRELKDAKDVGGLIKALDHPDLEVQYQAVEALGDLRDPQAIPPLVKMLSEDRFSALRWKSSEALAKIGKEAVDPLVQLLGHPNEDVRWKAAIALGEIQDTRAIVPLIDLLTDEDNYVKGRAAFALGMIGQPAVPDLIRALSEGDGNLRWGAAIALGRIRDPRATAPLIRALGDKYENVRSEALASLKQMDRVGLDLFIQLLNEVGNQEIREMGERTIDRKPDEGGLLSTEHLANMGPDMRRKLVTALRTIDDPDLEPLINDLADR